MKKILELAVLDLSLLLLGMVASVYAFNHYYPLQTVKDVIWAN